MPTDHSAFFLLACHALGSSQKDLGEKLGVSRRTAQRYSRSGVPFHLMPDLARLVYPHDDSLASDIARGAGQTLESLGLVKPPPAKPPAPPPPPSPPEGVVDAVVCAAAEAMEMMPRDVRPGLLAALVRAREIGVPIDLVERVLRKGVQGAAPSAKGRASS